MTLSGKQLSRYMRHLDLAEIGVEGQYKLSESSVLIVGAGGLGAPVMMYLAAAGIGTIGVADDDLIEESNLQRQVIYTTPDVGHHKVERASEYISELNPDVKCDTHAVRITAANVREIISSYDLIVDGTDNFTARFLLNDACHFLQKTLVSAAIRHWEGQLSTFKSYLGDPHPCYRCLHPEPDRNDILGDCREGGMAGPVAGVLGGMQAVEVIKELVGAGQSMSGRIMLYDALTQEFKTIKVGRDENCPLCGDNPRIKDILSQQEARLG